MEDNMTKINKAAEALTKKLKGRQPEIAIILGSGLGNLVNDIEDQIVIPYSSLPGFPKATAIGHKGNFISGKLGGKQVLAMQGRLHYYEGYSMDLVVLPIRVMVKIGVKYLFVSNAAGGMNKNYSIGDLVLIKDHINLLPNPLIGPNLDEFGPRFSDMTCAYDLGLRRKMISLAKKHNIKLQSGVYVSTTGPCYETPAEYKYFRSIGADLVGMSTTPEVIIARHSKIKVLGVSVVTDLAPFTNNNYVTDEQEIIRQADLASSKMTLLFKELIKSIKL